MRKKKGNIDEDSNIDEDVPRLKKIHQKDADRF